MTLEDVIITGRPETVEYDLVAFITHAEAGYGQYEYLGKIMNVYDFYYHNEIEFIDHMKRTVYLKEIVED